MDEERRGNSVETILLALGRLEGKVESSNIAVNSSIHSLTSAVGKQNGRITKLEMWRNALITALVIVSWVLVFFKDPILNSIFNDRWTKKMHDQYASDVWVEIEKLKKMVVQ